MLTQEQRFILDALRAALRPERAELSAWSGAALDEKEIARQLRRHGILSTVYPVLKVVPALQEKLRMQYYAEVGQAVRQDTEGREILHGLDAAGLDCIALKGWVMRELYPRRDMRGMSDLDILVRPYDFGAICAVMRELDYPVPEKENAWKHDNFTKDTVKVEMHKRLTDDSGEAQRWESDMWKRARPGEEGSHILRMSDEDYMIFHLLHMYKDLCNGSLGLRRIADTWLFRHTHPAMDEAYLAEALGRMELGAFAARMDALSRAVMGEGEPDAESAVLLDFAFGSGNFGGGNSYQAGRLAAMSHGGLRSGKLRSLLAAVFLPPERMAAQYPRLERAPVLLPWFWGVRIVHYLRKDWRWISKKLDYSGVSEEDFRQMRRVLEASGLKH